MGARFLLLVSVGLLVCLVAVVAASASSSGSRAAKGPPHLVTQAIADLTKAQGAEQKALSLIFDSEYAKEQALLEQSQTSLKAAFKALETTSANVAPARQNIDSAESYDASAMNDVMDAAKATGDAASKSEHGAKLWLTLALEQKADAIKKLQPKPVAAVAAPVCNIGSGPPKNDGAFANATGSPGGVQGGVLMHCGGLADTVSVDVPGHALAGATKLATSYPEVKSCSAKGDTLTCKLDVALEQTVVGLPSQNLTCVKYKTCYSIAPSWSFAASDPAQQSGSCGLIYYVTASYLGKTVLPRTATQAPAAGPYCNTTFFGG